MMQGEIQVSSDSARRRANGYLARYVALAMGAKDPVLVWGPKPVWRMAVYLNLRGWGQIAKLGEIDVNVLTSEVLPLSKTQIIEMQEHGDAIATHLASTPT